MIDRFNLIYFKERTFVAGCWCTIFDVFLFLEWWGGLSKWGPGLRLFLVRLVAVVSWCLLLLLESAEVSISARGSTVLDGNSSLFMVMVGRLVDVQCALGPI